MKSPNTQRKSQDNVDLHSAYEIPVKVGNNQEIFNKVDNIENANVKEEESKSKADTKRKSFVAVIEENNKYLLAFKHIRPYIIKLFSNLIIFYLAIVGWREYLDSNKDYEDFIINMNKPLIVGVKLFDNNVNCKDKGLDDIVAGMFPSFNEGCQCDENIMVKKDCNFAYNKFLIKGKSSDEINELRKDWNKECTQWDLQAEMSLTTEKKDKLRLLNDMLMFKQSNNTNHHNFTNVKTNRFNKKAKVELNTNFKRTLQTEDEGNPINGDPGTEDPNLGDGEQENPNPVGEDENTNPDLPNEGEQENPVGEDENTNPDLPNEGEEENPNPDEDPNNNGAEEDPNNDGVDNEVPEENPDNIEAEEPMIDSEIWDDFQNDVNYDFPGNGEYDDNGNPLPEDQIMKVEYTNVVVDGVVVPADENGNIIDPVRPQEYKRQCDCYRESPSKPERDLKLWSNGSKICVKKDSKWSTLKYLSSIKQFRKCKKENRCQKYFCKEDDQECPLIDIWIKKDYNSQTKKNNLDLKFSTNNTRSVAFGEEYMSQVLLPMLDLQIILRASCNSGGSKGLDYGGITNNFPCSVSQVTEELDSEGFENILNSNGGLFDEYSKDIPDFKYRTSLSDIAISLESKHVFYRASISCLMRKANATADLLDTFNTDLDNTSNTFLKKLSTITFAFVSIQDYFSFQKYLQQFVLYINAIILGVAFLAITIKIISIVIGKESYFVWITLKIWIYFSFAIDLISGIVGGAAYFIINDVLQKIKVMSEAQCIDDYSNSNYAVYTNSLQGTANLNLQIFIFIIFKFALILFTCFYYCLALRCKLEKTMVAKIFFESIADGDEYEESYEVSIFILILLIKYFP